MRKAFWNLLEEKVAPDTIDTDWLVRLYAELPLRLTRWLHTDSPLAKEIREAYDIKFFQQLLVNGAFDVKELRNLVNLTFAYVKRIQAPPRDADLERKWAKILALTQDSEATFGKATVEFLKAVHGALDEVEEDMQAVQQLFSQPSSCQQTHQR